jgi:hypothetical protein
MLLCPCFLPTFAVCYRFVAATTNLCNYSNCFSDLPKFVQLKSMTSHTFCVIRAISG